MACANAATEAKKVSDIGREPSSVFAEKRVKNRTARALPIKNKRKVIAIGLAPSAYENKEVKHVYSNDSYIDFENPA